MTTVTAVVGWPRKSNQQTQIARVGFDKAKGMDYPGGLFLLGDDYLSHRGYLPAAILEGKL